MTTGRARGGRRDDEPPARRRLRALLEEVGGVEIIAECADGVEAVAAIEAGDPEVVFLDVRMPGLDGFEVVEVLGEEYAPAVVFVTAHGEHAVQAFEMHAVDYLRCDSRARAPLPGRVRLDAGQRRQGAVEPPMSGRAPPGLAARRIASRRALQLDG